MSPFYKTGYDNQILGTGEFLYLVYTKIKHKVKRLQEIEGTRTRGKISLPNLKEKFEITHNILESLTLIMKSIDSDELSKI
jgi:hypothetical protein